MKYNCRYSLCFAILLLASCVGQEQDPLSFSPPIFPETIQVNVTPFCDEFLFNGPFLMEDLGDYFVVGTFHEDKYLHIFDKERLTYVKSFGSYGRGPGEFLGPPRIRLNEDKSVMHLFQYYGGMNDYWDYNVKNVLYDSRVLPFWEEQIVFFRDKGAKYPGYPSDFIAWKDKRLFMGSRMHRLEVQDTLGNTLCLYDKYPVIPLKQASDSTSFSAVYRHSALALKPDLSRFVIASRVGCILEFFTIEASGKIEKEREKRFYPPIFFITKTGLFEEISGETILGISYLSVTDELIYAQYNGNVSLDRGNFPRSIAVFDWSGNPIRRYNLEWKIYRFIVDAQRNRCYLAGIDQNDEIRLGYFDL